MRVTGNSLTSQSLFTLFLFRHTTTLTPTKPLLLSLSLSLFSYVQTMPINKDPSSPQPVIGKMGPYTIFITPPPTPKPLEPVLDSPNKKVLSPPPVQPPPLDKSLYTSHPHSDASVGGLFTTAVTKLQNAHSSLDEHLARWFGLNQSKYQWALDDYLENKGLGKEGGKVKEISSKIQNV